MVQHSNNNLKTGQGECLLQITFLQKIDGGGIKRWRRTSGPGYHIYEIESCVLKWTMRYFTGRRGLEVLKWHCLGLHTDLPDFLELTTHPLYSDRILSHKDHCWDRPPIYSILGSKLHINLNIQISPLRSDILRSLVSSLHG